ncbi:MAG: hypothetical protein JWM30_3653, partial [Burkholderia sp.]|nr:hypothetical protein [Burkholderia sp.]
KRPKLAALRHRTLLYPFQSLATRRHLTGSHVKSRVNGNGSGSGHFNGNGRCAGKVNSNCRCAALADAAKLPHMARTSHRQD